MCQQHEITPNSAKFSSMHDFDYARLQDEKWGPDTFMREKLNGSPMYRVSYDSKKYMMGFGMAVQVPDDFPISVVEWTPEGTFTLFPFAFPVYSVDGLQFRSHDWVSVDAVTASAYTHGAVFLIEGVEYRSRRYPSVEVDASEYPGNNQGVWEKTAHAFLRPRPGRSPMSKAKANSALGFAVPLACMELPVQKNTVTVRTSGPYQGAWGKDASGPWFDSGVRVTDNVPMIAPYVSDTKTSSAVLITDVYNIVTPQGLVISPFLTPQFKNVVTGSKVVLFDEACNTYLISDEGKLLDLVGGRVEVGESSFDAVQREIKEETGLVLEPKFVGISSQYDAHVEFHSYVYIAPCSCDVGKMPQMRLLEGFSFDPKQSVPWLGRLIEYVNYRSGGRNYGLKKLYASLDRVRYRPKRVIYDKTFESEIDSYTTRKTLRKRDEGEHHAKDRPVTKFDG